MVAHAAAALLAFGAFTGDPYSGNLNRTDALQRQTQRQVQIVSWYQNWGGGWISQVHPDMIHEVTRSGRTPMLTWEPWNPAAGPHQPAFSLRRIIRGRFDGYIDRWARGLARTQVTVYLRPMHEMDGDWYPWSGSARRYKMAWRHMHDRFQADGATNVRWVWAPNADAADGRRFEHFYPGDRYVDVLGLDGYNWGSSHPEWGGWRSFSAIFRGPYDRLTRLADKPIWLTEVGAAPEGGSKPRWVRNMFVTAARWARLKAIVWFNDDKEADWRATSDPATAAAFNP